MNIRIDPFVVVLCVLFAAAIVTFMHLDWRMTTDREPVAIGKVYRP